MRNYEFLRRKLVEAQEDMMAVVVGHSFYWGDGSLVLENVDKCRSVKMISHMTKWCYFAVTFSGCYITYNLILSKSKLFQILHLWFPKKGLVHKKLTRNNFTHYYITSLNCCNLLIGTMLALCQIKVWAPKSNSVQLSQLSSSSISAVTLPYKYISGGETTSIKERTTNHLQHAKRTGSTK